MRARTLAGLCLLTGLLASCGPAAAPTASAAPGSATSEPGGYFELAGVDPNWEPPEYAAGKLAWLKAESWGCADDHELEARYLRGSEGAKCAPIGGAYRVTVLDLGESLTRAGNVAYRVKLPGLAREIIVPVEHLTPTAPGGAPSVLNASAIKALQERLWPPEGATVTRPTLSELGAGKGALWSRADDETQNAFAATAIMVIDAQRNIDMDDEGKAVMAAWLKQCVDREAPNSPERLLARTINACMQSMTDDEVVELTMAQQALKKRKGQ